MYTQKRQEVESGELYIHSRMAKSAVERLHRCVGVISTTSRARSTSCPKVYISHNRPSRIDTLKSLHAANYFVLPCCNRDREYVWKAPSSRTHRRARQLVDFYKMIKPRGKGTFRFLLFSSCLFLSDVLLEQTEEFT